MSTGMLWYDDSKSPLAEKIRRAAEYFEKKFGKRAQVCLVHPKMLLEAPLIDGIVVRGNRIVLPGHLWLGREEIIENPEAGLP